MATAVELIKRRAGEPWLKGFDPDGAVCPDLTASNLAAAAVLAQAWLQQQSWTIGQKTQRAGTPVVLLAIADPSQFLAWFAALVSLECAVFLGDPAWSLPQWQQVTAGLAPDLIIAQPSDRIASSLPWEQYPVENFQNLWKTRHFPQDEKICGKRRNALPIKALNGLEPPDQTTQPVEQGWIGILTGGSSGQLRFALHRWSTLTASVSGLQRSPILEANTAISACCMLPLHHVSGLLQFLRALLSGGSLILLPWTQVVQYFFGNLASDPVGDSVSDRSDNLPASVSPSPWDFEPEDFFLSLVPTQLQRLLREPIAGPWLARFRAVFLGGAPAWPALLNQARGAAIRLAPTYGLTETASQVVTLAPADFLRGQTGCGKLLPHARIALETGPVLAATDGPVSVPVDEGDRPQKSVGIIRIWAQSLALGYYSLEPDQGSQASEAAGAIARLTLWNPGAGAESMGTPSGESTLSGEPSLLTDDLGYFDDQGYLHIIGRISDKIISGGENIFPAVVEAAILAIDGVRDAVVLGLPDDDWGERVVAVVVAPGRTAAELGAAIAPLLSPPQRPKQWLWSETLPRNAQGKVQRRQVRAWAMAQLGFPQPE